jgi:hypothetical protein
MHVNSSDEAALSVGGSARFVVESATVVGDVSGLSNITAAAGVRTRAPVVDDPYREVTYPAFHGCTNKNFSAKNVVTINPGVYCGGISINSNAEVTLNPGVYYIDGGDLSVNGGASLTGTGVTLVFTSKNEATWPDAKINGNATIHLTAPKFGSTAGIVIFGDRRMPTGTSFKFNGGSSQYLGGAVYLPKAEVTYTGGASTSSSCTQLISDTVTFSGNSSFAINCSSYNTRPFGPRYLRLSS